MHLLLFHGLRYNNLLLLRVRLLSVSPRFSLNSVLRIQIEMTMRISLFVFLVRFAVSVFSSASDCFDFSICICVHTRIYLLYARMYVGMCNGMGRRAPVGAIVAAQITMPDRRRGQTSSNRGAVTQGPVTAVAKGSFHA